MLHALCWALVADLYILNKKYYCLDVPSIFMYLNL
jgi:hypothetical protein